MNGKVQGIIICGVIAASLAGVMLFLNSENGGADKDSSSSSSSAAASSEDESVIILEKTADDITAVHVTNTYGEFDLSKPSSGKSGWTIEQLSGINQNSTKKDSLRTNCGELEAKKLVEENAADLSKYGLDQPSATVDITYSDDTTATFYIGSEAPESRYLYVKTSDSSNVYMVLATKLSYYTDPVTSYADLTLIAKPSDDEWPDYGTETISRKDWDYEVKFENDPHDIEGMLSSQVMSSPIFAYLNITGSNTVTHGMWGLTATECVAVNPDDDVKKEYGLDDPFCTVNLKGDEYDYKLSIGNEAYETDDEGNVTDTSKGYYCYLEGVKGADCVYIVSTDSLPWATFKIEDVISSIMTTNYLVDLSEITIEHNGEKTTYEITSNGSSSETLDDGSAADVTSVTLDGKELDVDNFKSLYQYIMTCPTSEIYFKDPEGESVVTITEKRADGGEDVIELYKDTARRYIVKLNGRTSFRIQSTWIDILLKNMDNVKNGIEVDDNY